MIDQLMAHSHLRYKGEGPQATPKLANGLLTLDPPQWPTPPHQSPDPCLTITLTSCLLPRQRGTCRLMASLLQVLCPCYSATSSLGCPLTSWTPRSTCSWCPSWTAKRRVKTRQEQVFKGIWVVGEQVLPQSGGGLGPTFVRGRLWPVAQVLRPFLRSTFQSWGAGRPELGLNLGAAGSPGCCFTRRMSPYPPPSTFQDPVPAHSSPCSPGTAATPVSSPW